MERDKKQENYNSFKSAKVDLNSLLKNLKDEEKKNKRTNMVVSTAAISALAVFGIILTL